MTKANRKYELENYISSVFMPEVYKELEPSEEDKESDEWFDDTFIQSAINGYNINFYYRWLSNYSAPLRNVDKLIGVDLILELLNDINTWFETNYGEPWKCDFLTDETVINMYAYIYVMDKGIDEWKKESIKWIEEEQEMILC